MASVNFQSQVLIVESTKGLLTGALLEKSVAHILRVDFPTEMALM